MKPDVLGERIMLGPVAKAVAAEVIGIARDAKVSSLYESPRPHLYVPFSQEYSPRMSVIAKTEVDPGLLPEVFRRELHGLDAQIPLFESKTMLEHMGSALYVPRALSGLLTCFGALAMVLAGLGLYSVVAFSVAQRDREVGIRMALGAGKNRIVRMVLQEGMILILIGLGIGLIVSVVAMQPLSGLLIDVSAIDPFTFFCVSLLLASVSVFASYVPARRAAKSDPVIALRQG
jgi:putative ABC transport system permease protein